MVFEIGKWFDEKKKNSDCKLEIIDMKDSFGEKSLKEWYKNNQKTKMLRNDTLVLVQSQLIWESLHGFYLAMSAVSCLGQKRCLELLKRWWKEK